MTTVQFCPELDNYIDNIVTIVIGTSRTHIRLGCWCMTSRIMRGEREAFLRGNNWMVIWLN